MVARKKRIFCLALLAFSTCLTLIGCSAFQSEKSDPDTLLTEDEASIKLVGDLARTWGLKRAKIQGVAMVANLPGTGSDPDPSAQRKLLIEEMKRHDVDSPNGLLGSNTTALVVVEAILPPAVRKGDRIDVLVKSPSRSRTTSLEGGWLMNTRMQELAVLGNQIRSGRVLALAQGPILVNAKTTGDVSEVAKQRGVILGGGVATKSRTIGLVLTEENHSVSVSRRIGNAINRRFFQYDRGIKRGAATPKRDNFIELAIQPQYRSNLMRYVRVVEAVAVNETSSQQMERMNRLGEELMNHQTSVNAALQLEAIGHEATNVLLQGVQANDPLVRFYSAESLAYLNHEAAVEILEAAAAYESSLRWRALTALSAMTKLPAHDALSNLLHVDSAEARYGAFQALQDAYPRDPLIRGENLKDVVALHEIASHAQPMVHIRKSERPEIVVFGNQIQLETPCLLSAGPNILVKSQGNGQMKVTRFEASQNQTDFCSTNLADVIRTIAGVGGSYSDIVTAIKDAKGQGGKGSLNVRVAVEAIPRSGRKFDRTESTLEPESESESELSSDEVAANVPLELLEVDDE